MKSIYFLLLIVLLVGCSDSGNELANNSFQDSLSADIQDSLLMDEDEHRSLNEDTVSTKNVTLIFNLIDKNKFLTADTSSFITKDSTGIQKDGQRWLFKLGNGEEKNILTNDSTNDGDNYQVYSFIGNIQIAGQWLFHATYYETDNFILIDKMTGETIALIGYPSISPSKKYLISVASDLISGQGDNGIDIFAIQNNKINNIATIALFTRGINEVRWLDENTMAVEENFLDGNVGKTRYAKIDLLLK